MQISGVGLCSAAAEYIGLEDLSDTVLPVSTCCWMLLLDVLWLSTAAVYLQNVLPQQYGSRLPWHYPVTQFFWLAQSSDRSASALVTREAQPSLIEAPGVEQHLQRSCEQCVEFVDVKVLGHCVVPKIATFVQM